MVGWNHSFCASRDRWIGPQLSIAMSLCWKRYPIFGHQFVLLGHDGLMYCILLLPCWWFLGFGWRVLRIQTGQLMKINQRVQPRLHMCSLDHRLLYHSNSMHLLYASNKRATYPGKHRFPPRESIPFWFRSVSHWQGQAVSFQERNFAQCKIIQSHQHICKGEVWFTKI